MDNPRAKKTVLKWFVFGAMGIVFGWFFVNFVRATQDPIGIWNFEENTGSTTADSSSSGNNGAITGATWTTGRSGSALSFSGPNTNDKVDLGVGTGTLDSIGNTFTITAWIKTPTPTQRGTIFSTGYSGTGVVFGIQANGGLEAYYPTTFVATTGTGKFSADTWYHVAYVKNGTGATNSFYINGAVQSNTLNSTSNYGNTAVNKYIGYRSGVVFNGVIDELRVYDRALSAIEIAGFINSTPALGSISDSPDPVDIGSSITFSSGTWTDTNGSDTQKMFVCKTNALSSQSTGGCAGGTWYSSSSYTSSNPITGTYTATFSDYSTSPNSYYTFICDSAQLPNSCTASGSGAFTAQNVLTVGTTGTQVTSAVMPSPSKHIGGAFTFIRDAGTTNVTQIILSEKGTINANSYLSNLKLYYKQETNCSSSIPGDATAFNTTGVGFDVVDKATVTGTMTIGTSKICVYPQVDISGYTNNNVTIDFEISTPQSNITVSAGNILPSTAVAISGSTTVSIPTDPVALWRLDENTGTSITDSSGFGNNGTVTGASWVAGKSGSALSFGGPNGSDQVDVGTGVGTLDYINNTFTIAAWIKPANATARGTIFSTGYTGAGVMFGVQSGGGLEAYYPNYTVAASSTGTFTANNWYHVVYVKSGVNDSFYINGAIQTNTVDNDSGFTNTSSNKYIGYRSGVIFNGVIDEVSIYRRSLSSSEVVALYNHTPNLGSISDSPDPVSVGSNITFSSGTWTDADSDTQKLFVCKTDALSSQSTGGCAGGSWYSSSDYTSSNPVTGAYTATADDVATSPNSYYTFICDVAQVSNSCSSSSSGTFTVQNATTVGASGTQATSLSIPSTGQYVGGSFTLVRGTGSVNVTQIVVSEKGTVNANSHLSNLKLYYKQEATCSSSIPGDATAFNSSGVTFNASDQATATGTIAVGTSQICVYAQVNVGMAATDGQTLELEITNPSTDVTLASGTASPSTAIAIVDSTTLNGVLAVDIVDDGGNSVSSPSVGFSSLGFSFAQQTGTGTLGNASEKIRVLNTRGTVTWTLSIAATGGGSALWNGGTPQYDYNDASGASDGGDGDSYGGQLTINPSVGSLAAVNPCVSTAGISKGSGDSYNEGVLSSITLLTAGSSATTNCQWDLTSVSLNQLIPERQLPGVYTISFTVTVI